MLLPEQEGHALRAPVSIGKPLPAETVIDRLKNRPDFLRAAKGRRWHGKGFSLQGAPAAALHEPGGPAECRPEAFHARVGFTVTKKVGCAVVRNRVRRRLREALRLAGGLPVVAGHDYVVIARIEALRLPFSTLQTDLSRAIRGLHAEARPHDKKKRPSGTPVSRG